METQNKHEIVDSVEKLEALLARVREAEKTFCDLFSGAGR